MAVIEHATNRITIAGATAYLSASWVARAGRYLVMDLEEASARVRFLIRD